MNTLLMIAWIIIGLFLLLCVIGSMFFRSGMENFPLPFIKMTTSGWLLFRLVFFMSIVALLMAQHRGKVYLGGVFKIDEFQFPKLGSIQKDSGVDDKDGKYHTIYMVVANFTIAPGARKELHIPHLKKIPRFNLKKEKSYFNFETDQPLFFQGSDWSGLKEPGKRYVTTKGISYILEPFTLENLSKRHPAHVTIVDQLTYW